MVTKNPVARVLPQLGHKVAPDTKQEELEKLQEKEALEYYKSKEAQYEFFE